MAWRNPTSGTEPMRGSEGEHTREARCTLPINLPSTLRHAFDPNLASAAAARISRWRLSCAAGSLASVRKAARRSRAYKSQTQNHQTCGGECPAFGTLLGAPRRVDPGRCVPPNYDQTPAHIRIHATTLRGSVGHCSRCKTARLWRMGGTRVGAGVPHQAQRCPPRAASPLLVDCLRRSTICYGDRQATCHLCLITCRLCV